MQRLLLCSLLFAWGAAAQFGGLAPNGDGSALYFSSPLRLRGSEQSFDWKIFRLADSGPELFRSQEPGGFDGPAEANFHILIEPRVSTDGSRVAFTGQRLCYGGSGCVAVQTAQGTVLDRSGTELVSAVGYVDLSPNGRYALFFGRKTLGNPDTPVVPPTELVDLATGARTLVPYAIRPPVRRRVANDGTVALIAGNLIRLWSPKSDEIVFAPSLGPATSAGEPLVFLSADGQRLVYQTATGLALSNRTTPGGQPLTADLPISVSISDDARVVAFVSAVNSQVYLAAPTRQLTHEMEGIRAVALSGDGRVAFAVTALGRLIRIDTATGAVAELAPRSPWITNNPEQRPVRTSIYDGLVPGSVTPLTGIGLSLSAQSAAPPLPLSLGGVRVRIGGVDAPIQSVSPELVWFQVPWDIPVQDGAHFEFVSGDSPFEAGPGTVAIRRAAPDIYGTANGSGGRDTLAVHQDWSALVTPANPARRGEIVHFYFYGLGPVTPPVTGGEAGPSEPLAQIIELLRCRFRDRSVFDSRIVFAGLAPGLVGIYQVSLQVPEGLGPSSPSLTCYFENLPQVVAFGSIDVGQ